MTNFLLAFTLLGFSSLSALAENVWINTCKSDTTPVSKKIVVQILDEYRNLTAAKIRVTGKDTVYYAPENHAADFNISEAGGDVMLDNNRRFAYVEGSFTYHLPETLLRFEVIKGFAYSFYDTMIQVMAQTDSIQIQLKKWFDFPDNRWYSGDVHVHHIDPPTALLEMKAEDLNVCNILTSDFTHDNHRFRGGPEISSDTEHVVYVNQEYREDRLGHVNLLNIKKLIEPVKPMRPYQYPLNMQAADETHAQGGHVSWAHFASWPGLEGPLAIVMQKIDAVELLCAIDPFYEPVFVSDVVPDLKMNSGLRLWYRLLNCGLRIPATAGTDKMNNRVSVGANRVYAMVEGKFNYQSWINALNKGRSFVTNSPFIFCRVNDKIAGDELHITGKKTLTIEVDMWTQLPVDRLEIIVNGNVVAEKIVKASESHASLNITYTPQKSVWIAARAHQFSQQFAFNGVSFLQRRDAGAGSTLLNRYYGTARPETTFAHTNPTYVILNGKPLRSVEDAQYFQQYLKNGLLWLDESGKFPNEKSKKEVLDAFRKGIDTFKQIAK
ncbi:MAG TPA: CehA/McbA family metallohydrolase [Chryseolinea sp.]|nr:CehA/McbA family metallohydrolase [Chryseolinea sp.]